MNEEDDNVNPKEERREKFQKKQRHPKNKEEAWNEGPRKKRLQPYKRMRYDDEEDFE